MKRACAVLAVLLSWMAVAADPPPADRAEAVLRRALDAMATRQRSGGWGNAWTPDNRIMWGEYRPIPLQWITVQPPATPTIASVYLRAARVLNDKEYARRAELARDALLAVQTPDGGFPYEADPAGTKPRVATFDDDTTTGALDFLMAWWQFSGKEADRQAVLGAGEFLLRAQYPDSGGWPQTYPALSNTFEQHITFNDNVMENVLRALLKLHRLTKEPRFLDAAIKGGDCILKLQGGPGEAIWAAQYDHVTLKPAWARKFEPPAYAAAESLGVCDVLIDVYLATGLERFLDRLPSAFAWYDAHKLPNGKWARFYEAGTQRPVYGRRDKAEPVYDLEQAAAGYSWQGDWYPHAAKQAYERIKAIGRDAYAKERETPAPPHAANLEPEVRQVCDALSPEGWWPAPADYDQRRFLKKAGLSEDTPLIECETFCRNAGLLLTYLERARAEK